MTKFRITRTLTVGYLIAALALSFVHIAGIFLWLGAGWQSWIMPVMIDTVIVIGKLTDGPDLSAKAKRAGKSAVYGGLSLSLLANIGLGIVHQSPGEIIAGLVVVGGALWAERHMSHHRPKAVRAPRVPAVKAKDPKRVEAARKAAATRKINAARLDGELAAIAAGR